MGMAAVDVFQKAYQLVFNDDFRKADDETKKTMIWEAIKLKRALTMDINGNSTVVYEENGQKIQELSMVRVLDGIVYQNETIKTILGNVTDSESS